MNQFSLCYEVVDVPDREAKETDDLDYIWADGEADAALILIKWLGYELKHIVKEQTDASITKRTSQC